MRGYVLQPGCCLTRGSVYGAVRRFARRMRCPGLAALAVAAARAAPSRAQLLCPSGVDLRDDGAAEDDQCVGDQRFEFVLAGVDRDGGDERAEFRNVLHDGFVVGDAARQDDGVNLSAEDIAEAVWQQSQGAAVHRPISLQFSLLYWLGQITPAPLTRWMMALINRP